MNKEEIVEALDKIWNNENYKDFYDYKYLVPELRIGSDLLFIGINPSFSEADLAKDSYQLDEDGNKLQYFKKMEEIATYCKSSWTHLDLFFFRKTDQKHINHILGQKYGPEFLMEQLNVSNQLIIDAHPKIIIVSNALARLFLGFEKDIKRNDKIWLGYNFQFDEQIGTHKLADIPVFFSGMLSGQRALDVGSYIRLKWHVKKVLENLAVSK